MTSQLNVDTIVDKAGSGGSNVKMANTSTYVSDGGNVAQNTVQGLCKAWIDFNGTGTIATRDSFNVTSITDGGTGLYTVTIANDMSNDDYSTTGAAGEESDGGGNRSLGLRARAAGSQNLRGFRDGVSADDIAEMHIHIMGDLA